MKRLLFVIFSGSLTLFFLVAVWQDTHREWNHYQDVFIDRLGKDERRGLTKGITQIISKDLRRVDRCTTCHMAIDKPQLALAEEPFTAHPGKFLTWHPVEKFGCTVCHGGQGLATEVKAAHGDVQHWEQPLLRGELVQASCAQCHGDLAPIAPYVPTLLKGRALFKTNGCYGCHAIRDFGQTVSQDLTEVGSKSYQLLEADFEMIPPPAGAPKARPLRGRSRSANSAGGGMMEPPHDRIHWVKRKLWHPRSLNPGVRPEELPPGEEEVFPSAMPHFGLSEEEIAALTTYVLSLTDANPPASYVTKALPEPTPAYASTVEQGKAVFEKYGCAACHGIGGVGGRRNPNSGLGSEIPSLMYVKAYYGDNIEALKHVIRTGRQPVPRQNTQRPFPPLYMPAWKDRISDADLDALIAYLLTLGDRLPQPAEPASPAPATTSSPSARLLKRTVTN